MSDQEAIGVDVEAKLIEQDHRLLKALYRFIRRHELYNLPGDPRKSASVKSLLWILFSPLAMGVVVGMTTGIAALAISIVQLSEIKEQNRIMRNSATVATLNASLERLRQTAYQLDKTMNEFPIETFSQFSTAKGAEKFATKISIVNGVEIIKKLPIITFTDFETEVIRFGKIPEGQDLKDSLELEVDDYYFQASDVVLKLEDPLFSQLTLTEQCILLQNAITHMEFFRDSKNDFFKAVLMHWGKTRRNWSDLQSDFVDASEPEYSQCKENWLKKSQTQSSNSE